MDDFVSIFIDDILVYSKTIKNHVQILEAMLRKLRDSKLYSNGRKNKFVQFEIELLGHVVTNNGIKQDMKKVKVIWKWKWPSTQKD